MKVYALLRAARGQSATACRAAIDGDAEALWRLRTADVLRGAWSTPPGAVLLLESAAAESAASVVGALGCVQGGVCETEVIPVGAATVLERLFGSGRVVAAAPADLMPQGPTQPFLAVGRPGDGVLPAGLREVIDAEAADGWALDRAGLLRDGGLRAGGPGAVLLLEAEDEDHARRIVATLALVRVGLLTFECLPLAPFAPWDRLLHATPG